MNTKKNRRNANKYVWGVADIRWEQKRTQKAWEKLVKKLQEQEEK